MRLYDTKRDSIEDSIDDEDESNLYPFRMTKAELQSLDPNFKEKKKKVNIQTTLQPVLELYKHS